MTIGRGIIKYIDIDETNNGHIEIDDRMKPMHDYLDNKKTLNLTIGRGIRIKVKRTRVFSTKKHIFEKKFADIAL